MKYIDAERLKAEIVKKRNQLVSLMTKFYYAANYKEWKAELNAYKKITSLIKSLQQEQPKADLEKLKNKAELIANEIMMGVQANKYHTCIYNKASNDFNHSHLFRAALKGIELGLDARKEE